MLTALLQTSTLVPPGYRAPRSCKVVPLLLPEVVRCSELVQLGLWWSGMKPPFTFDPFDEATRRNPFPVYARARQERPLLVHAEAPAVSLFLHEDIQGVLRDPSTWSSEFPDTPTLAGEGPSMLLRDPPVHTRLRGLVSQAFTPRMIRQLEARVDRIAHELMDAMLASGHADLIDAFAHRLSVTVIAEMLGVPLEDRVRFREWSTALVANLGGLFLAPLLPEQSERQMRARREIREYFARLVEQRHAQPRDDLLSDLIAAEIEASRLSFEELLTMLTLLLVAGNETTTLLIGNAVLELLAHPDQLAALRAEPDLLPGAVDEVLRFSSPVQMLVRRALLPIEVRGHRLESGSLLLAWVGSANRDEAVFARPEVFDVTRRDNHHLAFGLGPHYCLGASLTALEAEIALRVLLERTRGFHRIDDSPLPLHPSIAFRGVGRLPLVFEAAA